jgi:hypothetical protein
MLEKGKKFQPVQVFAPVIEKSPFDESFSRDLQRAIREFKDEDRIWLVPDTKKVARFKRKGDYCDINECIIPSEDYNCLYIYHIDEYGAIFNPLQYFDKWENKIPDKIYKLWLENPPDLVYLKELPYITANIPKNRNGKIIFEEIKIKVEPGPSLPIKMEKNGKKIIGSWPPIGLPQTISPETESKQYKRAKKGVVQFLLEWKDPFDILLPNGGNLDTLMQIAAMRKCIEELSNGQKEKVLKKVASWKDRFLFEGETTIEKSWFFPKFLTFPRLSGLMLEIEGRFGIDMSDCKNPYSSEEFIKIMSTTIKIDRIYSWLGYFWWSFYNDISSNVNIRYCKNCGNIISGGRSDRKYCNEKENIVCFKKRQASRQKKRYKNVT